MNKKAMMSEEVLNTRQRVVTLAQLAEIVAHCKRDGKTVALCHGCFDILHFGHVRHFEAARRLADVLVATVTPDRFVHKGPNRPVFPEEQRAEVIAGLRAIDWVAVNEWDGAIETIHSVRPNVFIKGEEYESPEQLVNPNFAAEVAAVRDIGGRVEFTRERTSSSTAAVRRMQIGG